jgi:hypothetical protein
MLCIAVSANVVASQTGFITDSAAIQGAQYLFKSVALQADICSLTHQA